jgi:CBS domain-containing protein
MSPRAACRLETLGFEQVYDYVPGKSDWLARGLPSEGENADRPRVCQLARDDVVTCSLDTPIEGMAETIAASPYGFALVVAGDRTVLGRLRRSELAGLDPHTPAEEVMSPGPSTVRADLSVEELRERLDKRDLKTAIVSTPEGKLIGVVTRSAL